MGFKKQAEAEVVVKLSAAYPIAEVCSHFLRRYPAELPLIFCARMFKRCPWIIPFYEKTSTNEGMKRNGYKRSDDDRWEPVDKYAERQAGIFAVYAATASRTEAPLGPGWAWRWVARLLNLKPDIDVFFYIMATFMDVVGPEFVRQYKRQASKCFDLAETEWGKGGQGPRWSRFMIVCENWRTQGQIGLQVKMNP